MSQSSTTKPKPSSQKIHILQYNKLKGTKKGQLSRSSWNREQTQFRYEDQIAQEISTQNKYMAAIVDPVTGNIMEWKQVVLMDVNSLLKGQDATGDTTQQGWSMQYKKKLAEEFGTSKSKRKINQMLSNTINA